MTKRFSIFCLLVLLCSSLPGQITADTRQLIKKGWAALIKDNDTLAITYFELAYERALKTKDVESTAEALLHLGISYYGVSLSKGLEYGTQAMQEFKKLESSDPEKAYRGRCRCLQLFSTISGRQGKFIEVIRLSREALPGFPEKDSSGYRGLIYTSLAQAFARLNEEDSSALYYQKALAAQLLGRNFVYLSSAYVNAANEELKNRNAQKSRSLYSRALSISDSTGNRQGYVLALIGMGKWQQSFGKKDSVEFFYGKARQVATALSDRSFLIKVLKALALFEKEKGDYRQSLLYQEEISSIKDSIYSRDKQKLVKSLEVQFNLAEKDRKLTLLEQEKDIAQLSSYLLAACIVFVLTLAIAIILFLRRSNARNTSLLQTKEALLAALEEQKRIREHYLQNEIEFRESQLSTMALQIMQKNDLLKELKEKLDRYESIKEDQDVKKIINRGLNQDKDWIDFNSSFESLNKNFYIRLKEAYPEISQNDLKLCALIKLNLSIKEMAGILNISPDSVKTARYRLRKKLQLSSEENLSEFISKL